VPEIIRVIIDTNHIISAILSKRGASAKLADWMIREDYFQLLISQPIWNEYCTVASWLIPEPKQHEKERILDVISFQAEWIESTIQLHVCSDLSDNCFLECAVAGKANYLVTKNIKHFPPKEYSGVKIVHIRKLLLVLEQMEKTRRDSEETKKYQKEKFHLDFCQNCVYLCITSEKPTPGHNARRALPPATGQRGLYAVRRGLCL